MLSIEVLSVLAIVLVVLGAAVVLGTTDDGVSEDSSAASRDAAPTINNKGLFQIDVSPVDGRIFGVQSPGDLVLCDSDGPIQEMLYAPRNDHITELAHSPTANILAIGMMSGAIQLLDSNTFEELRIVPQLDDVSPDISRLKFSNDGELLFVGDFHGALDVWRVASCERVLGIEASGHKLQDISIATNGRRFGFSRGRDVQVRELPSGTVVFSKETPGAIIRTLALDCDGSHVAVGNLDGKISLMELKTGRTVWENTDAGLSDVVRALRFSPDGQRLAAARVQDRCILMFDPATGEVTSRLRGHHANVKSLIWIDDRSLCSASYDGVIRNWTFDDDQ